MTFKEIGDIEIGDMIVGSDGEPTRVTAAYDVHVPEKMFEIELEDGSVIKASGNHLWYVETSVDKDLHKQRIRVGRKFLKNIDSEIITVLEDTAYSKDEIETSLIDMVTLLKAEDTPLLTQLIVRVAESIGHVAETNTSVQDMETGEQIDFKEGFRTYDARLFCQQLLVLTGQKKYVKKWDLICGRVVSTENLLFLGENISIPVLKEHDTVPKPIK